MNSSAHSSFKGQLKFLADLSVPPVYVPSKGGGDKTEHQGNYRTHEIEIHDARKRLPETHLDREGFKLVPHKSVVSDFYDDKALRSTYHRELVDMLKRVTGAQRIEIFDDTRRSSSSKKQREHGSRDPANIVHNDYTDASGVRRLEDFLRDSPDEAQRLEEVLNNAARSASKSEKPRPCSVIQSFLKQQRFAIVNAWRPIGAPVADHPLVICDARTVRESDLVSVERRGEDRTGELQVAVHDPGQRWYYYPRMTRDEVLLFKTFDSAHDGRTRFTPHSSCKDPSAPGDAPPRESLETRCLVFF